MKKPVLLTGHKGYVGSVMTRVFQEAGQPVTGLDTGYYADCTLFPGQVEVPEIKKDIRDLKQEDLAGFDAVVHLAALSNDPIGNLNPEWTKEINLAGSIRLAELAKGAGVRRFLFSSSCIMYGMSTAAVVTEESPLDPKTDYARSKVEAERAISRLAGAEFSPVFLRNGTIYGLSACMRFDTVLNNLMGSAITTGKVVIHGDGTPWRPVVHVQDVARAFLHLLEAPMEQVHNQPFNVGDNGLNHQILSLAEGVARAVPGAKVERLGSPEADQRTYKTDFGKFARTFPDFRFRWTVDEGTRELYGSLKSVPLAPGHFTDRRFTRLKWLRHLLETGALDESLRWRRN